MNIKISALIALAGLSACGDSVESEARKLISERLKDPESAQFRNVFKGPTDESGQYVICGEVNAKNNMGGYTGYVGFLTIGGKTKDIPNIFIGDDYEGRTGLSLAKSVMPETKDCPF